MIEAYVDNLGKYVRGDHRGDWLKLPASQEDVKNLLSRIGVDGVLFEEIIITDYKSDAPGLTKYLDEYANLDELNYLAALLDDMDDSDFEKFTAAVEYGEYTSSVKDLINLTDNLDNYEFYPGVTNDKELGHYLIDELGYEEIPEWIVNYFDYEAYGDDHQTNEGGVYSERCGGYVEHNHGRHIEHYGGRDDIPDEYRVFAYPDPPDKMPIKQQLEMFAKMMTAPAAGKMTPAIEDRA